MKTLEVVYDSRLSPGGDDMYRYLSGYAYTLATVAQVSEEEECRCNYCGSCILPTCFFVVTKVFRTFKGEIDEKSIITLSHCRDCYTQVVLFKRCGKIDWSKYICRGICDALHATWAATHLRLLNVFESYEEEEY